MKKYRMFLLAALIAAMTFMLPACGAGAQEEVIEEEPPVVEEEPPVSEYDDGQEFVDMTFGSHVDESANSSGVDIPKEKFLYDLLIRYQAYTDGAAFDANDPAGDGKINIMFEIASDDLVNAVLYNVPDYQAYSEEGDPRGLGSDMGVIVSDRESSDWLAENIFNVSADGIAEAVAAAESENSMYAEGDKYYGLLVRTGMGMAPSVDIKECAQDGNVYDLTADFSVNGSYTATAHAKAEIKNIDGTWYWTLHSYSAD